MLMHLKKDVLSSYYSGDLSVPERRRCEEHLRKCDSCRGEFTSLVQLLDENVSPDEIALLDNVEATIGRSVPIQFRPANDAPQVHWWSGRIWNVAAVAASIILAVAVTWAVFSSHSADNVVPAGSSARTLEARLSGQPYSEFIATRTGVASNSVSSDDELKRLSSDPGEIGRFYLQHNDFEKAVVPLEHAVERQPDSVEICNDLGIAYMESASNGALENAIAQFKRALELNPGYQPARFNLALAYERLGDFSHAREQLSLYLQLDGSSGWAKEVRSKLQLWKH
jgi:tetratricopeptide (TPR) repeat protein